MKLREKLTTEELASIIFVEFFDREFLEPFEKEINGKKISLRESFIEHYRAQSKVPRLNEKTSKLNILRLYWTDISEQKNFLNYQEREDGTLEFDFSVFDLLFKDEGEED